MKNSIEALKLGRVNKLDWIYNISTLYSTLESIKLQLKLKHPLQYHIRNIGDLASGPSPIHHLGWSCF